MIWNKRAIVLNFILAILIALIIFVPTILFASELFRISDQGKENFRSFVRELRHFAADEATQKTFLLILDEKTAVFLFAKKESVLAYQKQNIDTEDQAASIFLGKYYLPFPESKCPGTSCACLCQKFNEDKGVQNFFSEDIKIGSTTYKVEYDLTCDQLTCEDISQLPMSSSWSIYRNEDDPRRTTIIFEKAGEEIVVTKQ